MWHWWKIEICWTSVQRHPSPLNECPSPPPRAPIARPNKCRGRKHNATLELQLSLIHITQKLRSVLARFIPACLRLTITFIDNTSHCKLEVFSWMGDSSDEEEKETLQYKVKFIEASFAFLFNNLFCPFRWFSSATVPSARRPFAIVLPTTRFSVNISRQ